MATSADIATKERVRKHREALYARGLRPVTRLVPDTRDPKFIAEHQVQIERHTGHFESECSGILGVDGHGTVHRGMGVDYER